LATGRIYLDNAATSFPKPPEVYDAMMRYARDIGASPGRGQYAESRAGAAIIRRCREGLAKFLGNPAPNNIIFTLNTSDALNLAIKGVVRQAHLDAGFNSGRFGGRASIRLVTTSMDHNSVLRPFAALAEEGATVVHVPCDPRTGLVDLAAWREAITPENNSLATLAAINWVSNVTGTIQPVADAVSIARQMGVPTLVDVAQGLGHLAFDQHAIGADLVAFPGHKGLLGPQGTGGLSITPGFESRLATTREGGTGSIAEFDAQPATMPERFEAGSHNTMGIAGLAEGVAWLAARGIESIRAHELQLIERFLEACDRWDARDNMGGFQLIGPRDPALRVATFTLVHQLLSPSEVAALLEQQFGILARAGIHCAPLAHRTMGTLDHPQGRGGTRVSFGPFVTQADVASLIDALATIDQDARSLTKER